MTTPGAYDDLPAVLDVPGVAAVLGCSPDTVRRLIGKGQIHTVSLGRLVRIPRHHLVAFLAGEWDRSRIDLIFEAGDRPGGGA